MTLPCAPPGPSEAAGIVAVMTPPDSAAPVGPSRVARIAIAVGAVVVGVPALLAAWIGLIFLFERLGLSITANELLGWLIAVVVAVLLWPLALRATIRMFWNSRQHPRGTPARWGSERLPAPPRVAVGPGDRALRIVVLILGGLGLVAVCGPSRIPLALLSGLDAVSSGGRSWWAALQLGAFVLVFALMLPTLWITGRALRTVPRDDPRRLGLELRQTWYASASTAWVICALLGMVFAWLVITRL